MSAAKKMLGGSSSSRSSNRDIRSNPLVFDTPAYNEQFKQSGAVVSGDERKGLERRVSNYRSSNPLMAQQADAINSQFLAPSPLIQIPQPPAIKNEMGTLYGANASLVNPALGVTQTQNGGLQVTPPQQTETVGTTQTPAVSNFQAYLNSIQGLQDEAPSATETYNELYKASGLRGIERDIQNYTAQINNITAKAQAESLALEGQGRGITESIIGGQQAQISREAAIQALPLQALLANAQGNKELAMTHLDTMYKLQMQDAQSKYDYKLKVLDAVYQFADKQEQRRLDEIATEKAQEFQLKRDSIEYERQILRDRINFDQQKELKQMDLSTSSSLSGTLNGKPQTISQSAANGYADRLTLANQSLNLLGDKFTGKFAIGGSLPNILQSGDRQSYEQAKRNFATAVLRRESGASIAPSEFETLEKTYFPVAGDGPDVLAQKTALRNTVINSFYREANVARPVVAGDLVEQDGTVYKVADDNVTLIEI